MWRLQQPISLIPLDLHFSTRGHTDNASCTHTSSYKLLTVDEGAQASRQPAESHLDILHAQDVPTVIHVLLKVFVLEERKDVRAGTLQAHKLQQLVSLHTPQRVMNNNNVKYFNLSIPAENILSHAGGRLQRFLLVSPGIQTPVWATCLCGRCRAASRCWRASGPSVETLRTHTQKRRRRRRRQLLQRGCDYTQLIFYSLKVTLTNICFTSCSDASVFTLIKPREVYL